MILILPVFCLLEFVVLFFMGKNFWWLVAAVFFALVTFLPSFSFTPHQNGFEASHEINEAEIDKRSKASKLKRKLLKINK